MDGRYYNCHNNTHMNYQSGGNEWLYPNAGDGLPAGGAKVLLLTKGGIATIGAWDPFFCVGWLPLPKRNKDKEKL